MIKYLALATLFLMECEQPTSPSPTPAPSTLAPTPTPTVASFPVLTDPSVYCGSDPYYGQDAWHLSVSATDPDDNLDLLVWVTYYYFTASETRSLAWDGTWSVTVYESQSSFLDCDSEKDNYRFVFSAVDTDGNLSTVSYDY